jgi:hypothetical protein
MDSNTHPNAFRAEAEEKRQQVKTLIAEANALEAQANELEGQNAPEQSPAATPSQLERDDARSDKKKK